MRRVKGEILGSVPSVAQGAMADKLSFHAFDNI